MKSLNVNEMMEVSGGLCVNDGRHGLEIHFGDCFSVCNLLNLMNPTYNQACIF